MITTVDAVPSRNSATALVLSVADDPAAGARDLARAVSADPALTCRVLALANSSYYGLSRRVATLDLAVSVVGFNTVRAMTLTLATGLDGPEAAPEGFWEAAALCATAAGILAPTFEAPPADAFCLGLLHSIGSALLHRAAPLPSTCLPIASTEDEHELARAEIDAYGLTHSEAGAQALSSWNFPPVMCDIIARHHHDVVLDSPPLARVLRLARICASLVLTEASGDSASLTRELARISHGRLIDSGPGLGEIASLLERVRTQATPLLSALVSANP